MSYKSSYPDLSTARTESTRGTMQTRRDTVKGRIVKRLLFGGETKITKLRKKATKFVSTKFYQTTNK